MIVTISEKEAQALIELKQFIAIAGTRPSDYMWWMNERLVQQYKEDPNLDYVSKLCKYARLFSRMQDLLEVRHRQ